MAKKKMVTKEETKRTINLIVLHCSDSDNPKHDNPKTIHEWHLERGFDSIGYHYVITKDGIVHCGREENEVGAHAKNHNAHSIGICLTGKLRTQFDTRQFKSLRALIDKLLKAHGLDWKSVKLHNQLDPHKTCPNFTLADAING